MALMSRHLAEATADRRTVAAYDDHRQALRAVDVLRHRGFPQQRMAIMGAGLRDTPTPTNKVSWAWAGTGLGIVAGGVLALAIALLVAASADTLEMVLVGAGMGAVLGAGLSRLSSAVADLTRATTPEHYEVLVDSDVADRAIALLEEMDHSRFAPMT